MAAWVLPQQGVRLERDGRGAYLPGVAEALEVVVEVVGRVALEAVTEAAERRLEDAGVRGETLRSEFGDLQARAGGIADVVRFRHRAEVALETAGTGGGDADGVSEALGVEVEEDADAGCGTEGSEDGSGVPPALVVAGVHDVRERDCRLTAGDERPEQCLATRTAALGRREEG